MVLSFEMMKTAPFPRMSLWLLAAAGLLLTGCGRDNEGDTVVLRVGNWGGAAVDKEFMAKEREILQEFEQAHPGVKVRLESIPGPGQYVPKMLMSFVAGNPPDVIHLDASSAAVFINNGFLSDLTPLVEADPSFHLGDFFENVVNMARRGDKLYAIPLDFTPMMMYYNKRLFDEAGVPYPQEGWTRGDFLRIARELTYTPPGSKTPARYGFDFENHMPFWFPWIWANGGDVLSPDGTRASGYLDSPETIDALQFIRDLILEYHVTPSLSETAAAGVELFRRQKAAMKMSGHWSLIDFRADKIDVGVIHVPCKPGHRATVIYEVGLAVSRVSPHQKLAWEYVKFMTSRGVQKRHVSSGIAISANREVAESLAGDPIEDAFLHEVRYGRPPWGSRVDRYEVVEDLGREMMESIIHNNVPVPKAVAEFTNLIDAELRRQ